jgi:hypothetical protein
MLLDRFCKWFVLPRKQSIHNQRSLTSPIKLLIEKTILDIDPKQGFFFQLLWCNHIGNDRQEPVAEFDYRSDRKVEKFKNPTIKFKLEEASMMVFLF